MKRLNKMLFMVFAFVAFAISANAADFSTYVTSNKTSITAGEQFTVTVGVKNAKNLYGMTGALTYDSNKLTLVGNSGANGFAVTVGKNLVVDSATGKSGTFKVATLTFKAKSSFVIGESTAIKISGVTGSDGNKTLSGVSSYVNVKMVAPKASNNFLSSLSVSGGNISFNKNTTSYKMTVEFDVTSVTINATAEDSKAKVSGVGSKNLNIYNNDLKVIVTAENGSTRTYTISIIRKDKDGNTRVLSSDASLSGITVEGYPLVFAKDTKEYTILLKDNKALDISAVSTNSGATIEVVEPDVYAKGNNVIKINVTAENGATDTYIINAVLVEEVKVEVPTCDNNKCSYGLVIFITMVGTLLVGTLGFFALANAGFVKFKSSNTKTSKTIKESKKETKKD